MSILKTDDLNVLQDIINSIYKKNKIRRHDIRISSSDSEPSKEFETTTKKAIKSRYLRNVSKTFILFKIKYN